MARTDESRLMHFGLSSLRNSDGASAADYLDFQQNPKYFTEAAAPEKPDSALEKLAKSGKNEAMHGAYRNCAGYFPNLYSPGGDKYGHELSYSGRLERNRIDFTQFIPWKREHKFSGSHGLLGYTYLGSVDMWINERLDSDAGYEVRIHESIHTNDEYETRAIVRWMLEGVGQSYHH